MFDRTNTLIDLLACERLPQYVRTSAKQQGVVLFFSLIALVVMSLAAVALIRSVDTNSLIAGNLAFKRSVTISADSGTESARNWLSTQVTAALKNNNLPSGYLASTVLPLGSTDTKDLVDDVGVAATGSGFTAGVDSQGNTITYVVQRMCRTTGNATAFNCLLGAEFMQPNDRSAGNCPLVLCTLVRSPVYRITAKVVGPKNTVAYIQAFAN